MLGIYDMHEVFNIGLRKLRRMQKLGCLNIPGTTSVGAEKAYPSRAKIDSTLRGGNQLSVIELVTLMENPDMLYEMRGGFDNALDQLAEVDEVKAIAESAPPEMANVTIEAAGGNSKKIEQLMEWMKSTIRNDREVSHWFLGVRLMLGCPPELRALLSSRMSVAFSQVRKQQAFNRWHTSVTQRTGRRTGSRLTYYHKPKMQFDL